MAEGIRLASAKEFHKWAAKRSPSISSALLSRSSLRILPLACAISASNTTSIEDQQHLALSIFRAGFLIFVGSNAESSALVAEKLGRAFFSSGLEFGPDSKIAEIGLNAGLPNVSYAVSAIGDTARMVRRHLRNTSDGNRPLRATSDGNFFLIREFGRNIARVSHLELVRKDIWGSLSADAQYVTDANSADVGSVIRRLMVAPLWLPDVRGNAKYSVNFPMWARKPWDQFKKSRLASEGNFALWVRWYEALLRGGERGRLSSVLFGAEAIDFEQDLAIRGEGFWQRTAELVNGDIERIIAEAQRGVPNELSESGDSEEAPPLPDAGPGPQYAPVSGKLSETGSTPALNEAAGQQSLHLRLKSDAAGLAEDLQRAANRYPELASVAREYAELIQVGTVEVDIPATWAVGGALAGFARSYIEQNVARTLAEPLEPQLDARLRNVVQQHGAFIMGFEQGRDLVHRADAFALDTARLARIEEPTSKLLAELTSNTQLVEGRTRRLHAAIQDGIHELGWDAARVGYSAYLAVRNSVRAMIKFSLGSDPNVSSIAGLLAGASVLAGDANAEFVRAAVPVIIQFGSQMTACFYHSVEMLAYVEWALHMLRSVDPNTATKSGPAQPL